MRIALIAKLRNRTMPAMLAVGILAGSIDFVAADGLPPAAQPATTLAPAPAPTVPETKADATAKPLSTDVRIVIVEWKIKKGHEQEFLDYWATKSTIPDRTGLIAEFMSSGEDRAQFPWINWAATDSVDATTFYNVGFWRNADDFMGQIGKYIDNNRPPMAFEADHRHRIFLAPLKWRIGMAALPAKDADGVK